MYKRQQYDWSLRHASDELKNDREIVLEAVTSKGQVLKYASHELKNDREIVFAAVKSEAEALQYASEELRQDSDLREICNALNY